MVTSNIDCCVTKTYKSSKVKAEKLNSQYILHNYTCVIEL